MQITETQAEELALNFLIEEWHLSPEDRDWFIILSCRPLGESWYVTEVGVEGLPDKWFIQVYDTGECDPSYTFHSPISASDGYADLNDLPELIAEVLVSERNAR